MGAIKIPGEMRGRFRKLDSQNDAELWERKLLDPGGEEVTLYYVGSVHSPERLSSENLIEARANFARMQLLAK